jgi:hypothetical protein
MIFAIFTLAVGDEKGWRTCFSKFKTFATTKLQYFTATTIGEYQDTNYIVLFITSIRLYGVIANIR